VTYFTGLLTFFLSLIIPLEPGAGTFHSSSAGAAPFSQFPGGRPRRGAPFQVAGRPAH
jgi:hypothetical protein